MDIYKHKNVRICKNNNKNWKYRTSIITININIYITTYHHIYIHTHHNIYTHTYTYINTYTYIHTYLKDAKKFFDFDPFSSPPGSA